MDAQSVKNTDTAGLKGYDASTKVSGIKRHIAVDTQSGVAPDFADTLLFLKKGPEIPNPKPPHPAQFRQQMVEL